MSVQDLETRLKGIVGERPVRFVEFAGVGATGMVVDLGISTSALSLTHYLVANILGFAVAVTWNFTGNWLFVFDRPEGSLPKQYGSYVGLHAITFGLRAVVLTALIEVAGVGVLVATIIGVGVAAIANYLGTERILDDDLEWFDAVAAFNSFVHRLYSSRLRTWLRQTGLYGVAYVAYMKALSLLYRDETLEIAAGDAEGRIYTEKGPEIVSALHTLEKEEPVISKFVDSLGPSMTVWDVGANIGVFAVLAADTADEVVGFEPVPSTVQRLEDNLQLNDADGVALNVALSDERGEMDLGLERDEVGTQTPAFDLDPRTETAAVTVETIAGDQLVADVPAPDALKIDVEGAEGEVLAGLEDTLEDVSVVVVETHGESLLVCKRLLAADFDVSTQRHGTQTYIWGERR